MKSKGIRTKFRGIMTCPTVWPGIEANMIPMAEKAREERIMQVIKVAAFPIAEPKNVNPTRIGMTVIPTPYMIPARVLPMRTASKETGDVRSLSKVWFAFSTGITTGPIEEEAKKSVCAMRTGICEDTGMFRPMLKERKRLKGKSIPNIRDGGRI